ncbi:phenylacetate--CoA ligase family protein [bacterium]|nr:phenylacetate--CoA ligase family protein [bacterium]
MPKKTLERALSVILNHALRAESSFYRNLFAACTVPTHVTLNDVERLPFVTKELLVAAPFSQRLFLPLTEADSVRVTSGTSGKGVLLFPRSGHVKRPWLSERCSKVFSYYYPYSGMDRSVRQHGVGHMGFDLEHPAATVRLALQYEPDGIMGPPAAMVAFGQYLEEKARARIIYIQLFGSRPSRAQFRALHTLYPRARISWDYASTEGNGISALPCETLEKLEQNMMHPCDSHFLEIIEPKTGTRITELDTPGELVLTTLFENNPLPMIRYRTGDLVQWVKTPCSCGAEATFEMLGRVDFDRAYLPKGIVLASELEHTLERFEHDIADDFELHIYHKNNSISLELLVRPQRQIEYAAIAEHLLSLRISPTLRLRDLSAEGLLKSVTCVSMPKEKVLGRRVTRIVPHEEI